MPKREKKEILVVLDSNILLSYLLGSRNCVRIIRAIFLEKRFTPVTSLGQLEELNGVLSRPKFKRVIGEIVPALFKREYLLFARVVDPQVRLSICDDPDDNMILESAAEAGADYIITGDHDLLRLNHYRETKIITPAEFIGTFL